MTVDRFGIFVDAGYLFAAGGQLCFETADRSKLILDHRSVNNALAETAGAACGLEHLRTYWYDGAPDARPTAQHHDIAHLPGVKLRLGRLVRGRQKGVDSRIVRDLIILSEERALSVAFLLGGDEDLREGVSEAQERGVRVVLMAVEPLNERNLSPTLAMEADDIMVFDRDFMAPHLRLRAEETATTAIEVLVGESTDPEAIGRAFADALMSKSTPEEITHLRRRRPRIPSELDRQLLDHAAATLGHRHVDEIDRKAIRAGFWQSLVASAEGSADAERD